MGNSDLTLRKIIYHEGGETLGWTQKACGIFIPGDIWHLSGHCPEQTAKTRSHMFLEETYTFTLWEIPTCNDLLSHNGFLLLYVFMARCYQKHFLNSSIDWIALSLCHRQIPQQQKEQTEFTGSEKLPVYSTLMREVVRTTWKTMFTSHILDCKRKKNCQRNA